MQGLKLWLLVTTAIILTAGFGIFLSIDSGSDRTGDPAVRRVDIPPEVPRAAIERTYAGSAACRKCHEARFEAWQGSHHALAERDFDPSRFRDAFVPARTVEHGGLTSEAREMDGRLELLTLGADGEAQPFHAARVIGVDPMFQLLIAAAGGRYQATALAFDPARGDWFDVNGDEDRRPHEWGFWTSRGMNWNSMCAGCHMTNLRKGYAIAADSYDTTWSEMAVGCEACHGPYGEHVKWFEARPQPWLEPWPDRPVRTPETEFDTCGSCHARRSELTTGFVPGEPFLDHFRPVLLDEPGIYHADGQVLEENYEFTSFLASRMHGEGVRCGNCHDPHTAGLRLPVANNVLCLSCHGEKIHPAAHSHHDLAGAGSQCVNCHMPITTYMQRDPRRDHGFTIPDPLLTKELGIPNACSRCHTDRSVDWAIEAADRWYGERLDRPTRRRARLVARGREGDPAAVDGLVEMVDSEKSPVWRAVGVLLLRPWIHVGDLRARFLEWLGDPAPLVRAAAVRAFDLFPGGAEQVKHLTRDVSRLVRIEAAWAQRRTLQENDAVWVEFMAYLDQSSDQPTGALQRGMFHLERNDPKRAEEWVQKAVAWDANAPPLRHAMAVVLSTTGRTVEAIEHLRTAERLEPDNAEHSYALGLAYAEVRRLDEAIKSLTRACDLDPQFARAWYNLGLAYAEADEPGQAIAAIERAENEDTGNPEYPYGRATIHARGGERAMAREAAMKALAIEPRYTPAQELLQALERE